MIELADTLPDVNVQPAEEYTRLLGYPRERVVEGRAANWRIGRARGMRRTGVRGSMRARLKA